VQGLSNAQIAEKRGTSNSAVEKMVARIAERLGIAPDDGNVRVILTQEYLKLTGKLDTGE
jgi:DNA-binding NarL/FixJ family response regulator